MMKCRRSQELGFSTRASIASIRWQKSITERLEKLPTCSTPSTRKVRHATVRNGRRALLQALLEAKRFDQVKGGEEVAGLMEDVLASPLLRDVLCRPTNFSFNLRTIILARINRAELGDFDALVLGLLLMSHFKGQIVVPAFDFYGREAHVSLIREERLIAGVNFLDDLPPKLRRSVLLIEGKEPSKATYEDAETLALYAGLRP